MPQELPNLTLGHWDKTQGLPLHLAQTDSSVCSSSPSPHCPPSMQQKLGPASSTGAGWGQGAGLQWLPCVTTWPVQHEAAMAAPGSQTQPHRPQAQASAVAFLLSVPIGKCH